MSKKDSKPGRIKSAVLNWLGFGLTDYEHWRQYYGTESEAGVQVTADKALTLSAVWACTRLVSQTIATLPLGLYQKQTDGSRRLVDDLPLARLIHSQPAAGMSAAVFWESIIANAVLHGVGYAEKQTIGGRLVALDFLPTDKTTRHKREDGSYLFTYTSGRGTQRQIEEQDMFILPGFGMSGRFGMSIISYGVEVFGAALAGNSAANSTFKNGLMPTTYFKMERTLKQEQREQFRQTLADISGALNAGKTPLLEGGMEAGQLGINPTDAQLLQSRQFSIEEVCRWFGVPPSMIGATDKASSWASSAENLNLWFLQYGLQPWLKRIEQSIWIDLLTPQQQRSHYAEFTVEGLLRGDTQARANFYSTALQNGWMSRNEVRRLENLPAIPGGDLYTAQTNLAPLEQLGTASGMNSNAVRAMQKHAGTEEGTPE